MMGRRSGREIERERGSWVEGAFGNSWRDKSGGFGGKIVGKDFALGKCGHERRAGQKGKLKIKKR